MKAIFLVAWLALGWFSGRAQSTGLSLRPYLGLGGLYGSYQINHSDYKLDYTVPVVVAGVQYQRWAFQLGVAHFHPADASYSGQYLNYNTNQLEYYQAHSGLNSWLVPLLARYSLRAGQHKLQVEALGGLMTSFSTKSWVSTTIDANNTVLYHTDTTTRLADYGLALGLGLRYSPVPFLALTADGHLDFYQQGYFPAVLPIVSAGVQYQFVR